jgi:hypothetical protein
MLAAGSEGAPLSTLTGSGAIDRSGLAALGGGAANDLRSGFGECGHKGWSVGCGPGAGDRSASGGGGKAGDAGGGVCGGACGAAAIGGSSAATGAEISLPAAIVGCVPACDI